MNITALEGFKPAWAGQFDTFDDWVWSATQKIGRRRGSVNQELPAFCVDTKGRRCHVGADFMLARDENAFPIRYFWDFEPL